MRNLFLLTAFVFLFMTSCDSGSSTNNTPSPSSFTATCRYCNGSGVVLSPYDGNYYYCTGCNGTVVVEVRTSGSNPSFGSSNRLTCGSTGCECTITRSELESDDLIRCGCGHLTTWHHN